jgi:hypothetical protein
MPSAFWSARSALLLALTASASGVGLLASPLGSAGCSGDDGDGGDGGEASTGADASEEGPNYCDLDAYFRAGGNGGACAPIAPEKPCFVQCEAGGGCSCVEGPEGTGIWRCDVDRSCIPKCAPDDPDCGLDGSTFADTGPIPEASDEPVADGPSDATDGEAPDASAGDASPDAAADAATVSGGDAGPKDASRSE